MQIATQQIASAHLAVASRASSNDIKMTKAAKDFEAMFMSQMLQPMFEGLEVDGSFGGGHGEETMRGFLVQEYGKAMATGTDFGLSDAVKSEMIRLQGSPKKTSLSDAKG